MGGEEGYLHRTYDVSPANPSPDRSLQIASVREAHSEIELPVPFGPLRSLEDAASEFGNLAKLATALAERSHALEFRLRKSKDLPDQMREFASDASSAAAEVARDIRQMTAGAAYLIANHPESTKSTSKRPKMGSETGLYAFCRWLRRTSFAFGEAQERNRTLARENRRTR